MSWVHLNLARLGVEAVDEAGEVADEDQAGFRIERHG